MCAIKQFVLSLKQHQHKTSNIKTLLYLQHTTIINSILLHSVLGFEYFRFTLKPFFPGTKSLKDLPMAGSSSTCRNPVKRWKRRKVDERQITWHPVEDQYEGMGIRGHILFQSIWQELHCWKLYTNTGQLWLFSASWPWYGGLLLERSTRGLGHLGHSLCADVSTIGGREWWVCDCTPIVISWEGQFCKGFCYHRPPCLNGMVSLLASTPKWPSYVIMNIVYLLSNICIIFHVFHASLMDVGTLQQLLSYFFPHTNELLEENIPSLILVQNSAMLTSDGLSSALFSGLTAVWGLVLEKLASCRSHLPSFDSGSSGDKKWSARLLLLPVWSEEIGSTQEAHQQSAAWKLSKLLGS